MPAARAASPGPWSVYNLAAFPIVITDADGRVVFLNAQAEGFWGVQAGAALGGTLWEVLPLAPPGEGDAADWAHGVLLPGLRSDARVRCRVARAGGPLRPAELTGAWVQHQNVPFAVLGIAPASAAPTPAHVPPDWALRDPLTGLYNEHQLEARRATLDAEPGLVLRLQVEDLQALNDTGGQACGDEALVITARAVAAGIPPEALPIRLGGPGFVVLHPSSKPEAEARALGEQITLAALRAGEAAGLPLPLRVTIGTAAHGPGGLERALAEAGDALLGRSGVVLRGAGAGRIVVTRVGRRLVGAPRPLPPPERADPDTPAFRQLVADAFARARWFVAALAPLAGLAVVEVAAGEGRITLEGGLAAAIGPSGQLLVTDISESRLDVARARAEAAGLGWVRFLPAPVEHLPLAAGTADLILGSTFLHLTDPEVALRAMARVVRPGGRVAVNAAFDLQLGPGWHEATEPVRRALGQASLSLPDGLGPRSVADAAFASAGLDVTAVTVLPGQQVHCPDVEVALAVLRGTGLLRLWLEGLPPTEHAAVRRAVEDRLRAVFPTRPAADWLVAADEVTIIGCRRGPQASVGPEGRDPWTLYRETGTATVITDITGRVVFVNAAAEALWGAGGVLGQPARTALPLVLEGAGPVGAWARAALTPGPGLGTPLFGQIRVGETPRAVTVTGAWIARPQGRFGVLKIRDRE